MVRITLQSIFFLALASTALAGRKYGRHKKIVKGSTAEPREFPYQIVLLNAEGEVHCGGSIIHPNFILTAGHCYNSSYPIFKIVAGDNSYPSGSTTFTRQERGIREFVQHEAYRFPKNDIALIYLKEPINIVPGAVETIKLSTDLSYPTGKLTIAGWGLTNAFDRYSSPRLLQKATLEIIPHDECTTNWRGQIGRSWPNVCYATPDTDTNQCRGDSGGALVQIIDGELMEVAFASFGHEHCSTILPGVGVLVAPYMSWIHNTMANILKKHAPNVSAHGIPVHQESYFDRYRRQNKY